MLVLSKLRFMRLFEWYQKKVDIEVDTNKTDLNFKPKEHKWKSVQLLLEQELFFLLFLFPRAIHIYIQT